MATIYAKLSNQRKLQDQTVVSERFDKQDEDNEVLDEIELLFNSNINQNLTESYIGNVDIIPPLEN